jgi:PhzF family phenazine biosynthesis protein
MDVSVYQIDAFTDRPFSGNPAAVCPLDEWLPDEVMQAIAFENNLSETAFFAPYQHDFALRWFTPQTEVPLCGHATLASAYVLFTYLEPARPRVVFHTRSGPLTVSRDGPLLIMDFPSMAAAPCPTPPALAAALGQAPQAVFKTDSHYMAVYASPSDVAGLTPDFAALTRLDRFGIIATAPGAGGDDADFVSRFFAPSKGIDEDPVTGSAHCVLGPFWAKRLGKTSLAARQISRRGGALRVTPNGERVEIAGYAAPFLQGTITLPD